MERVIRLIKPNSGRSKILWGVILICIVALFFVFSRDKDFRKDISVTRTNSYIEGLRIVNKKNGVDEWIVLASRADFGKDETTAKLEGVTINIKKEGVILNADSGTYDMNTKDLHLRDNIKIHRTDSVISANSLSWNPTKAVLSSDDKVHLENPKFEVEGDGFATSENNSRITLKKNVRAIFH